MTRPARARAAVGSALAFVVVGHAFLAVGLDDRWAVLRDPQYGAKLAGLRERIRREPGRPLVVALGTSRTELGLDPAALAVGPVPSRRPGRPPAEPLVFNFALTATGPLHQLLMVHRLRAAGIHPDWVLLEVLPAYLRLDADAEPVLPPERLTWGDLGVAAPFCRDPAQFRRAWLGTRLASLTTARVGLMSRLAPTWQPPDRRRRVAWDNADGFRWFAYPCPELTPEVRRRAVEQARRQFAGSLDHFHVSPPADRALREAIAACRADGIRVAVHLMPEGPAFRSWYPPGACLSVDAYLSDLSRSEGVPVIDARDWMAEEDFTDSHHLLPEAARRFSERFGSAALGPLLRCADREWGRLHHVASRHPPHRAPMSHRAHQAHRAHHVHRAHRAHVAHRAHRATILSSHGFSLVIGFLVIPPTAVRLAFFAPPSYGKPPT
jgi:hypothetical protein